MKSKPNWTSTERFMRFSLQLQMNTWQKNQQEKRSLKFINNPVPECSQEWQKKFAAAAPTN